MKLKNIYYKLYLRKKTMICPSSEIYMFKNFWKEIASVFSAHLRNVVSASLCFSSHCVIGSEFGVLVLSVTAERSDRVPRRNVTRADL